MSQHKYKAGDYVVLNRSFGINNPIVSDSPYIDGAILVVTRVDEGTHMCYLAKIPPLMGDFYEVWLSDDNINDAATKTLRNE